MDDIKIISNQNIATEKIGYDIRMIHKINEIYIMKILEKKYVNKLYGNVYVTGIDNISYEQTTYQNPNDSNFIINVKYSIIGITYFKKMSIAFVLENMIDVNNQKYFKKDNVIALINNLVINDKVINNIDNPIIITRVIYEPNYVTEDNILKIGLVCDLVDVIERTHESEQNYNIKYV
jgi:hypothetical protein